MRTLSEEQELFITKALEGHDVLVDACIGSGKTTAIQELCNRVGFFKQVLYLTYNKLLKLDARGRIRKPNVTVTNYHGYAYQYVGRGVGVSQLIQEFNRRKPGIPHVDLLILDEYQDLETEMSEMLLYIKEQNPNLQVVAVGDMRQKIYDKTKLDVMGFMHSFLKPDRLDMEFTQCFRLNASHAAGLGRIWQKEIVGVNEGMHVRSMKFDDLVDYLGGFTVPGKLLVLGPNSGVRVRLQNKLEKEFPKVYNKHTLWSSILEGDSSGCTEPDDKAAVFCTYDKSKGMERETCVVCGWTESYWQSRMSKPNVNYEVLRNVFLVAASRGKKEVIFLEEDEGFLSEETLSQERGFKLLTGRVAISEMFSFKYKDDVQAAFDALEVEVLEPAGKAIPMRVSDGLVDLSMCIGTYMECSYFGHCDIDLYIEDWFATHPDEGHFRKDYKDMSLDRKILYYVSLQSGQYRYQNQVSLPLVTEEQQGMLHGRLSTKLSKDLECQVACDIPFGCDPDGDGFDLQFLAKGRADALFGGMVWELKFVSGFQPEHYLQCACYMCALQKKEGRLWNVRTGELVSIRIPDRKRFLALVACAVTKGQLCQYDGYEAGDGDAQEVPDGVPDGSRDGALHILLLGKHGSGKGELADLLLDKADAANVECAVSCLGQVPESLNGRIPVYLDVPDEKRMERLVSRVGEGKLTYGQLCSYFEEDRNAFSNVELSRAHAKRFSGDAVDIAGEVWAYVLDASE